MKPERARKLLNSDKHPDFVYLKRFGYSLQRVRNRYPDGCPDHIIAAALMIPEEEVQKLYEETVRKMRALMGIKL